MCGRAGAPASRVRCPIVEHCRVKVQATGDAALANTDLTGRTAAFIGLGVMGFPMAGHLARSGADVAVYNRTLLRAEQWLDDYQGVSDGVVRAADTPAAAAVDADIVFMCVGNDDDVRAVALGEDGVLAGMGPDTVLVDHTTASQELALELDTVCVAQGIGFLDAPVSGGQAGAENGVLTIMCGGNEEHYLQAQAVMACYGKTIRRLGPVGFGQKAKMLIDIKIIYHIGQSACTC